MDSLTPSDLFSPSKARQQRAQAQDWAQIDSWLSSKYAGRSIPTFERNEETLKVLRELSSANEKADERNIVERVKQDALRELDECHDHEDDVRILSSLEAKLDEEGKEALTSLASTAIVLNTAFPDPEKLAHAIIQHTAVSQELSNRLLLVSQLQAYMQKQQSILQSQLDEIRTIPTFSTSSTLSRQTINLTRQTKHLRNKIREYEDKLASLQVSRSRTTTPSSEDLASPEAISATMVQQKGVYNLRSILDELDSQVAMYEGLPADKEAARREAARLEVVLDELRRERDELFEGFLQK